MVLKRITVIFIGLISTIGIAQESNTTHKDQVTSLGVGFSIGKTIPSISIFPATENQKGFDVSIAKTTFDNHTWAKALHYPKTGLLFSLADFGNTQQVGYGFTLMPYLDFGVLNKCTNRLRFQIGLGASYNNVIYDKVTNPGNFGISTHFTWAFRSFIYYDIIHKKDFSVKIGGGATHFSNGHTRLPNHGLNSFLATVKTDFNLSRSPLQTSSSSEDHDDSANQYYFSTRLGLGQKVLARDFNERKNTYTLSLAVGRIKNKTYKYGFGVYYRFYEDYYDYIKESGTVITTKFPTLKNNPYHNATALGVFSNFEVLMNHFSIETELGLNLYKPAYKLDWYLNNGGSSTGVYVAKEFGTKAKIKQYISSRLGFRYYAITANKAPKHNLFVAANINANLGQADFSELSLGYVYSPK
ncbi:acyloxyacyl hydrolase [Flavobacterium sp. TSSA_36]|uniref:acyloxyacyl hydrolase n=1 Tax=Flavobacterium sp. TSSA_36 TaxID=3447669 RepID=UPI003F3C2B9C